MIIMDRNEPRRLGDLLVAVGVPVQRKVLYTADYLIVDRDGHTVGIERKAISDFLCSIADRRIMEQLTQLRRAYRPILLLEGFYQVDPDMRVKLNRRRTGWHHLTVQMALFSIQNAGIRVFWTTSHETTVDVLRGLYQRAQERCLVGLDEWGMEDDDGGGPAGGPDDARLEPITSLVGAGLRPISDKPLGAGHVPATKQRGAVASEPPSLAIGRAKLPRDGRRPA